MLSYIRSNDGFNEISRLVRSELSRIRPNDQGEDLFQDVWCELNANWPRIAASYDPARGAWTDYLRGVIRNAVRKRLRKLVRGRPRILFLSNPELSLADGRTRADGSCARAEEARLALDYAFATLAARVDAENIEILERRLKQRQSVSEIAAALKIPKGTVSTRLRKMKRKLMGLIVAWAGSREDSRLQYLLNRKKNPRGGSKK